MPPRSQPLRAAAIVSASTRRANRVIDSDSSNDSSPALTNVDYEDEEGDGDEDEEDEDDDAADDGEEEDVEGAQQAEEADEVEDDEDDEAEDEDQVLPAPKTRPAVSETAESDGEDAASQAPTEPTSNLRIKLRVNAQTSSSGRKRAAPSRAAAQKSAKKTKKVADEEEEDEEEEEEEDDEDELGLGYDDDEVGSMADSRGGISPSKLTARQRARGNLNLQETLIALPMDPGNKKMVLTEAEKRQRREEIARRRKRQSEQKLQDEQDQTINRLLRAQTSRSRSKLDLPTPGGDDSGSVSRYASPARRRLAPENSIRWTSSIIGGKVVNRIAVPKGKEEWIDLTA